MGSLTQLYAYSANNSTRHWSKREEKNIMAFFIKKLSTLKERRMIAMKGSMCNNNNNMNNNINKFSQRKNSFIHSFIHLFTKYFMSVTMSDKMSFSQI